MTDPQLSPDTGAWRATQDLVSVSIREQGGVTVATISGEVDISNVDKVARALNALPNVAPGLVVDLSQADYLDSSAISLLHGLALRLRQRSQLLVIASPPGSPPRRVLELAAVHINSRILDEPELAVQALCENRDRSTPA